MLQIGKDSGFQRPISSHFAAMGRAVSPAKAAMANAALRR